MAPLSFARDEKCVSNFFAAQKWLRGIEFQSNLTRLL
jgi:hypothetical protein